MPACRHRALLAGVVLALALGCWALGTTERSDVPPASEAAAVDGAAFHSHVGTLARPLRTSLSVIPSAASRVMSNDEALVPALAAQRPSRPSLPLYTLFRVYRL